MLKIVLKVKSFEFSDKYCDKIDVGSKNEFLILVWI